MKRALGVAATTCSYSDWYGTDLVIFFGSNPANDQPVTTKYLHEAKKLGHEGRAGESVPRAGHGALLGAVERRAARCSAPTSPTTGSRSRTGGDIAFLYGVLKILIENGWHRSRLRRRAHRPASTSSAPTVAALDWTDARSAGRPAARAAWRNSRSLIRDARTAVLVWSMGITQHAFGGDAVQMILNLGSAARAASAATSAA